MKFLANLVTDSKIHISALNAGIWLSTLDWTIKILFGLPSVIYVCLKIYSEYLKKDKDKDAKITRSGNQ
jgi:hypothetical protein